eukprot:1147623-Pelagomonas_calceolata.AAC.4
MLANAGGTRLLKKLHEYSRVRLFLRSVKPAGRAAFELVWHYIGTFQGLDMRLGSIRSGVRVCYEAPAHRVVRQTGVACCVKAPAHRVVKRTGLKGKQGGMLGSGASTQGCGPNRVLRHPRKQGFLYKANGVQRQTGWHVVRHQRKQGLRTTSLGNARAYITYCCPLASISKLWPASQKICAIFLHKATQLHLLQHRQNKTGSGAARIHSGTLI